MTDFVCKVGDASGRIYQQVEQAQSEAEARQKLAERGYFVYSVRHHFDVLARFTQTGSTAKIPARDFLIFNQQFSTLVKAGLPILKCLDLLADRTATPRLKPILSDVRQRVRDGAMLSEALQAQGAFPGVYVTTIAAGERSGNITGVIDQYIAYLKVSGSFRNRLMTALIYPVVLVVVAILLISYVVTYAMPQFASLYHELGIPLPSLTAFMLGIALPLRTYFLVIIGAVALAALFIFGWTRSDQGALAIDRLKPRVPVMGDIWLKAQIAQFCRTLSTLLGGGTPLVPALNTAASSIDSRLIATGVQQAAVRVKEGQSLHASLGETKLIPSLALEMIEVGEASGALTPMLTSVAEFYEEEVSTRLERTLSWIPILILAVMATVVLFILLALYLPLFSLNIGQQGA